MAQNASSKSVAKPAPRLPRFLAARKSSARPCPPRDSISVSDFEVHPGETSSSFRRPPTPPPPPRRRRQVQEHPKRHKIKVRRSVSMNPQRFVRVVPHSEVAHLHPPNAVSPAASIAETLMTVFRNAKDKSSSKSKKKTKRRVTVKKKKIRTC